MTTKTLPESPGWMGDPKRGAALGRGPAKLPDADAPKIELRRVRLNNGGYDTGGAYWGIGEPLYWMSNADSTIEEFFRAANRQAAKDYVRQTYPKARFYN